MNAGISRGSAAWWRPVFDWMRSHGRRRTAHSFRQCLKAPEARMRSSDQGFATLSVLTVLDHGSRGHRIGEGSCRHFGKHPRRPLRQHPVTRRPLSREMARTFAADPRGSDPASRFHSRCPRKRAGRLPSPLEPFCAEASFVAPSVEWRAGRMLAAEG